MSEDIWIAILIGGLYLGFALVLLASPSLRDAVKALPEFIVESIQGWTRRTQLAQKERAFLKAYVKAKTEAEQKRLVIGQLRVHLTALGLDVSDFSDEEIEESCERFGRAVAESGITTEEAFRTLAAALGRGGA